MFSNMCSNSGRHAQGYRNTNKQVDNTFARTRTFFHVHTLTARTHARTHTNTRARARTHYIQLFVTRELYIFPNLHAVVERAEVTDLSSKDEIAELSVGKEDDEEHDGKSCDILGALQEEKRRTLETHQRQKLKLTVQR